jgi:hypothetical protein
MLAATVLLGALWSPMPVSARAPERRAYVDVDSWNGATSSGATFSRRPLNEEFVVRHCASDPVVELEIVGHVAHAIKGRQITVRFTADGETEAVHHYRWRKSGSGTLYSGLANLTGLPDGLWYAIITEGNRTLGKSGFSVESVASC